VAKLPIQNVNSGTHRVFCHADIGVEFNVLKYYNFTFLIQAFIMENKGCTLAFSKHLIFLTVYRIDAGGMWFSFGFINEIFHAPNITHQEMEVNRMR
jgi:hypothetical protein